MLHRTLCNTNSESAWSYWTCSPYRVPGYSPSQNETTLLYCAPAWSGYCTTADRDRLESFLRRCKRLGYYDVDTQSVVEHSNLRWVFLNVCSTMNDTWYTCCCLQGLNTATTSDADEWDDITTYSLQGWLAEV